MSGIIRVDMPKGIEEGQTSLTPTSPSRSNVTSPQISRKGALLLGTGVMAAKQTYTTFVQEIRKGGNEQLATQISNVVVGATTIGLAVGTSGATLIPQAINAISSEYTRYKENQRENDARELERSVKGSLNNYMNGGGG